MKKLTKIAVTIAVAAITTVSAMSFAACAPKHVHNWAWQRTETEHWQYCTGKDCEETREHATHDGNANSVCDTCAEFKALAFGFVDCKGLQGVDDAHADFAEEANVWFKQKGKELGYIYDSVDTYHEGWSALNEDNIKNYDLIVLLNDKPATNESRETFKSFMEGGGACVAFHAAGFAMWATETQPDPFKAPTEWDDWFSNTLLRCGVYGYCDRDPEEPIQGTYWNTWNPTSEPMRIETHDHYVTEEIEEDEFISAPCEWYEWHHNLFEDEDTTVLVSMNPTTKNPAGDNPDKASEIWSAGHHAIAWANDNYNMVYMNWGHNLQPYNNGKEGKSSSTFSSEIQNKITLNAMFGVVAQSRAK